MGASKALAEWAVEAAQNRYRDTRYASVRFGNVLGSSGSVVPIFRRQIAAGGPVTVTDEEMTRYFMTIPEAVQLIIRAADLVPTPSGSRAGESNAQPRSSTFVLEMGDPVRIVDLARNMIRLSGKEPDVDIAIEVVGRRPGEKIHEELFEAGERPEPTPADRIVAAVRPAPGRLLGRGCVRPDRGPGLQRRRRRAGRCGGPDVGRAVPDRALRTRAGGQRRAGPPVARLPFTPSRWRFFRRSAHTPAWPRFWAWPCCPPCTSRRPAM